MVQDTNKELVQQQAGHLQQWDSTDDDNENSLASVGEFEYQTGLKFKEEKKYQESFDWFNKAAELGHAKANEALRLAAYNLAEAYETGIGTEQNINKAIHYYKIALEKNSRLSAFKIARFYLEGKLVPQNVQLAVEYYKKSLELGFGVAGYRLGLLYHEGKLVPQNLQLALSYYQESANLGFQTSAAKLAEMYIFGRGVEKNYALAIKYIELAPEILPAKAMLVSLYAKGLGVEKSYEKAIAQTKQTLEHETFLNDAIEQRTCERMLAEPLLLIATDFYNQQNYNQAYETFQYVVNFNTTDLCMERCQLQTIMGLMNYLNKIPTANFQTAHEYFQRAAAGKECDDDIFTECARTIDLTNIEVTLTNEDKHLPPIIEPSPFEEGSYCGATKIVCMNDAKIYLAKMYLVGYSVERNTIKALEMLDNVETNKHKKNEASLIKCGIYANGYGIEKDLVKAIEFCEETRSQNSCTNTIGILYYATNKLLKAAECLKMIPDQVYAAYLLAIMYIDGTEVGRNLPLAREFGLKASKTHSEIILKAIDVDIPDQLNKFPEVHLDWSMKADYSKFRFEGLVQLSDQEETLLPGQYESFAVTLSFHDI